MNTIEEALQQLMINDLAEEVNNLPENNITENVDNTGPDYDFTYLTDELEAKSIKETEDYYIKEFLRTGKFPKNPIRKIIEEESNSTISSPQVGDIALLQVKLKNPKEGKKTYLGFERRPVLIINVKGDNKIDGAQITHSFKCQGADLTCIGKLPINKDGKLSYLNLYTLNETKNLETEYDFPIFKKDGTPITEIEFIQKVIGKLSSNVISGLDKIDPNQLHFEHYTYPKNYLMKLSVNQMKEIFNLIKKIKK